MKVTGIGTIELSPENMSFYNRKDYKMTGETITLSFDYYGTGNPVYTTYVVFTGNHTRYDSVRDCGNHYIYASYSSYYRIEKDSLEITFTETDR